jgi:hypothetical protein
MNAGFVPQSRLDTLSSVHVLQSRRLAKRDDEVLCLITGSDAAFADVVVVQTFEHPTTPLTEAAVEVLIRCRCVHALTDEELFDSAVVAAGDDTSHRLTVAQAVAIRGPSSLLLKLAFELRWEQALDETVGLFIADRGDCDTLRQLLDAGMTPHRDVVTIAASNGRTDVVRFCLDRCANLVTQYAFTSAVVGGHIEVVELLLAAGCPRGNAVECALAHKHEAILELLRSAPEGLEKPEGLEEPEA